MRSLTCVLAVVCYGLRKLRPCPSYGRRGDRINLGLSRSFYRGGGVLITPAPFFSLLSSFFCLFACFLSEMWGNATLQHQQAQIPPHPLSFPTPCRSPGGGGASLGQPKIVRCGSLCCCVGDCVVGHCHLYPLHLWQVILLIFAEMELDSTTMFPPGTSVMFIRSTGEEHVQEFKVKWSRTKKF